MLISQYEVVLFRNKLKSLEDLIQSVDLCCIDKLKYRTA